ncbi:hypothetical protein RUND412_009732 [Rhizina undulata]
MASISASKALVPSMARLSPRLPLYVPRSRLPSTVCLTATSHVQSRSASKSARTPAKKPPRRVKSTTITDTVAPQLSQHELISIYSEELFVFRMDISAAQIGNAMASYPQLRDVEILEDTDISNLARQLHTRFRFDKVKPDILPHLDTLVEDLKAGKIPGHPLASVHIISTFKEMDEFEKFQQFWTWLIDQETEHCDARVYGAAIEAYAVQGVPLQNTEGMFKEAIERYSTTIVGTKAGSMGGVTRLMLLQGVITARILHGDWRGAYELFDTCMRLYPTLTPSRIYELFIYERPVKEAYIVFLMACRAGNPPKWPNILTLLLKEVWRNHHDLPAMMRLIYAYVGAGGSTSTHHLNQLIGGVIGTFASAYPEHGPGYVVSYAETMQNVRELIGAFTNAGVPLTQGTYNTIISLGGKLRRPDLVRAGLNEMVKAYLEPTMVTHRVLVNAFGQLGDADQVTESWKSLCKARIQRKYRWDPKDWLALVKAGVATDQVDYVRRQLEEHKIDIGYHIYRSSMAVLQSELSKKIAAQETEKSSEFFVPSSSALDQNIMKSELDTLNMVFSSKHILDFSKTSSFAGGQEKILSIDMHPPTFRDIPPSELEKFYGELEVSSFGADADTTTIERTATGYSVEELKFENWKSINRLLYEAEIFEKETEKKRLASMKKGYEENEEGKKKVIKEAPGARLERLKNNMKEVKDKMDDGIEGWRADELKVRGRIAGVIEDDEEDNQVLVP